MHERLNILFLASEVYPFAKTGGLADVAGALPSALRRLGLDVRVALPFYREVKDRSYPSRRIIKDLEVPLGVENLTADVLEVKPEGGSPVYVIEREDLYDRPHIYGNERGDYYDNLERFTFFSYAALKTAEALSFKPHLVHCHDWQTGLVPALLAGTHEFAHLASIPTVFTIHNLGYPGIFPKEKFSVTGLPGDAFFHPDGMEYWGKVSLLKAGIVYADAVTTVSPTYARQIQTTEYGLGMEGVLRGRRDSLYGILNGVDYTIWDPESDPHLPETYTLDRRAGKRHCKQSLIREMDLASALENRPLLGIISRFDAQKGLDLLLAALDELLALDVGLIVLGSGDPLIERKLKAAAGRHPRRLALRTGFDDPLAHRIFGGADMLLIPSRYEPCGLTQIYALKYGTIPVARSTGGLEDTIVQFNPETGEGNGFKFGPFEVDALCRAVRNALQVFENTELWETLRTNAMRADFSWDRSARSYRRLYRALVKKMDQAPDILGDPS